MKAHMVRFPRALWLRLTQAVKAHRRARFIREAVEEKLRREDGQE